MQYPVLTATAGFLLIKASRRPRKPSRTMMSNGEARDGLKNRFSWVMVRKVMSKLPFLYIYIYVSVRLFAYKKERKFGAKRSYPMSISGTMFGHSE